MALARQLNRVIELCVVRTREDRFAGLLVTPPNQARFFTLGEKSFGYGDCRSNDAAPE
ncbi:hypothetical protein [Emcibacter sp.]|uniref:hypothetical protein n=1 Tax=Emcibacter sp. TaxID=1979954 RepID=UPI002AA814C5|nr:hypothetical protein [Emcibacter sp.]